MKGYKCQSSLLRSCPPQAGLQPGPARAVLLRDDLPAPQQRAGAGAALAPDPRDRLARPAAVRRRPRPQPQDRRVLHQEVRRQPPDAHLGAAAGKWYTYK